MPDYASCVVADIPGLIEGASQGVGMGHQFLRHIERTKVLVHLLDPNDPAYPDPIENYQTLRAELGAYKESLLARPEIICITKMDVTSAQACSDELKLELEKLTKCPVLTISAVSRDGLDQLIYALTKALKEKVI